MQDKHVIGYFTYKLNKGELNYSVMEKEEYAIIRALEKFKFITFGAKINIFTDNANILFSNLADSRRNLRWRYTYNDYDYIIKHIAGIDNSGTDFLSRIYTLSNSTNYSPAYD